MQLKLVANISQKAVAILAEVWELFVLQKEAPHMAVVYATLIIKGRKTIDQVPALLLKQVEEILADLEVEV